MGKVGMVEVGEGSKGSPVLIDLAALPLHERSTEHILKLYYSNI